MVLQRVVLNQADGHPAVAFRPRPGEPSTRMYPNGTTVMRVGQEGEFLKVLSHEGQMGYVKARNAVAPKARTAPVAQPVPQQGGLVQLRAGSLNRSAATAPAAPASAPVPAAPAARPVEAEPSYPRGGVCSFTVNGTPHSINLAKVDMAVDMSVHDWLEANVPTSGSRQSCRQGRCGACVLALTYKAADGGSVTKSFNSCLRPILACNGMEITTSRGLGSAAQPHPIQKAVADHFGTQCGFCSSGMVMNLYAQLMEGEKTAAELDASITGNYCRCTGYRPILSAYRSFGKDAAAKAEERAGAAAGTAAKKAAAFGTTAADLPTPTGHVACSAPKAAVGKRVNVAGAGAAGEQWVEVASEADLQGLLHRMAQSKSASYFLVGGHTSKGLWPLRDSQVYLSIGGIASLKTCAPAADGSGVWIGAGATMADTLTFLNSAAKQYGAATFSKIVAHGQLSPSNHIRNVGSIGGNIMIAHSNTNTPFLVDWPMLFEAAGGVVEVVTPSGEAKRIPLGAAFYSTDLTYCYLRRVWLPFGTKTTFFATYRHSPRHVYSEAFVAAAMACEIDPATKAISAPRLVFNGLAAVPSRVPAVEQALAGVKVADEGAFQALLALLHRTVNPLPSLRGAPAFRRSLVLASFYKFFLAMNEHARTGQVGPTVLSACDSWLQRETTSGTQTYTQDASVAPLNKAVPKIDGVKQCTAEAQYIQDIPLPAHTLYAAPVYAQKVGTFTVSDAGVAEKFPSYKGLVLAKDVPDNASGGVVFADGATKYVGQPIALALAGAKEQAVKAANAVSVAYTDVKEKLVISVDDGIAATAFYPDQKANHVKVGDVDAAFKTCDVVLEDTWLMNGQYHWHLETQSVLAIPTEDGLECHSATQMPVDVQKGLVSTLKLDAAAVVVKNKRLGGGFGGKLTNSIPPAQMTAVAAHARGVPVQMIMEYKDNLACFGFRPDWRFNYKIGANRDGTVVACKLECYYSAGWLDGDNASAFEGLAFLGSFDNCYSLKNWQVDSFSVKTDLPPTTSMRAPGWVQGIWSAERMISTVAGALHMDVNDVRTKNFYKADGKQVTPYGCPLPHFDMPTMYAKHLSSTDYAKRSQAAADFNAKNRWVKKAVAAVPSKFAVIYGPAEAAFDCKITVNRDGSVSVMSGGTEMGQGLTTKVVQTVAYRLGVGMDRVRILEQSTSVIGSTGAADGTGGSIGSELSCFAATNCCNAINEALAPVRRLHPKAEWNALVAAAYDLGINLSVMKKDEGVAPPVNPLGDIYNTYGSAVVEVTLDVLSGQVDVGFADIVFDLGRSVNPMVDIGQIEGGFVQGLGLALTETVKYNRTNGQVEHGEYYLPTRWEIPTELNVSLLNATPNPVTAGGGKAIGEPPLTLAYAAVEAVDKALAAAAADANATPARNTSTPVTVEQRNLLAANSYTSFKFKY